MESWSGEGGSASAPRHCSNTPAPHHSIAPSPHSPMPLITVACHAMATRFEIAMHGENPHALRAAGEEALRQIDQLEDQLSLFRTGSEISYLNARAAKGPVRVTPGLFALLQQAQKLSIESSGAFDITVAPLVRCWGFMGGGDRESG